MKKHILSGVLCFVLALGTIGPATAIDSPSIYLDEKAMQLSWDPVVINRTTYVSYIPLVQALYPDAVANWENGQSVLRAQGLTIEVALGNRYLVANGRYLYFPGGVVVRDGDLYVPVRVLAKAMGAQASWENGTVYLTTGQGPIESGDSFYNGTDLYWLSHIIHAESGNQPLDGKIAVGNVVLNRVEDPAFPDNIKDVVFQRGQFTPVQNGTIYNNPGLESIVAAKLCMEGANTAGDSMYFVNYHYSSWATRNRPHVATIGAHAFYS